MIKPRRQHQTVDLELDALSGGLFALTLRTDDEADHTFLFSADMLAQLVERAAVLRPDKTRPTERQ